MHYHLFMGAAHTAPMQSTKIEDYTESIKQFSKLSKAVFGAWEHYDLSFRNLMVASDFGENETMTLGTEKLCVQWVKCPGPCTSPSWN